MSKEIKKLKADTTWRPPTLAEAREQIDDHEIKGLEAELAEVKELELVEYSEEIRFALQYAVRYLGKIKTLQRQVRNLEVAMDECPSCWARYHNNGARKVTDE